MQEDFLHYIWKHKKLNTTQLQTTDGNTLIIKNFGQHNQLSGPDFFNAQLIINNQLWAGNVEMHLKSSDWYVHNHEKDKAYDNVILHVVWQHDTEIYRKDNTLIPTLILEPYVEASLLNNYKQLLQNQTWINCQNHFANVDDFVLNNWLERLYIERLEEKAKAIEALLQDNQNNWEATLFKMLTKNFGLKVNGEAFLSIANSIPFSVVRKTQSNLLDIEALLFGQAHFLEDTIEETHYMQLKKNYEYLKQKFQLNNKGVLPLQFFRLRPPNFPTIRLAQLAMLYHKHSNLFSKLITATTKTEIYKLFDVKASSFWDTHYSFKATSKKRSKKLTKTFIDLLIINTIIPIQFSYAKQQGKYEQDNILNLIKAITIEKNSIVLKFLELKPLKKHALNSQALLQLKQNYCTKNRCLQCAIGNGLVGKK